MATSEFEKSDPIPIARAAVITGLSELELISAAGRGDIALCVYAYGWTASPGKILPNGQIAHDPEKQRRLPECFLYLEKGFVRRFETLVAGKALETGIFLRDRSGRRGEWVVPKPRITLADLHVDYDDVQRLAGDTSEAPPRSAARFNHDPELQRVANYAAQQFIKEYGRKPTRDRIAEILHPQYPSLNVATIKRRIRRKW